MKIAIATIFYNNAAELKRLADSIPPNSVDYWLCIDGPFKYNIDKNPDLPRSSDDGSIDVIMDSRSKFNYGAVLSYKPNATEFDKRNTYLENCKKLGIDCIIIVDSDEYFTYDMGIEPKEAWDRFRKNIELEMIKHPHHNVYGIPFNAGNPKTTDTYKPRIWMNPSQMRYLYGSHYHYANIVTEKDDIEKFKQNKICYCQNALSIIKGGVTLTHDQSLRSPEYLQRRKEYQQYLLRYEELVQSHLYTEQQADIWAKENPATNYNP